MGGAPQGSLRIGRGAGMRATTGAGGVLGLGEVPDAAKEAVDAVDAGCAPRAALVPGTDEHQEQPNRVRAIAGHQLVRVDDVAARLAHAMVVRAQDLALVAQAQEWLVEIEHPHVTQRLYKEARVHQVQHCVLGAPGVHVHGHPQLRLVRVPGCVRVRRGVAQEIPRGVDEGVHRVGLAPCGTAVDRAGRGQESGVRGERADAGGREIDVSGQEYGQVLIRDELRAVLLAVHDRNRGAPVALATHQPIAQAVGHRRGADPHVGQLLGDGPDGFCRGHPGELAGVDEHLVSRMRHEGSA